MADPSSDLSSCVMHLNSSPSPWGPGLPTTGGCKEPLPWADANMQPLMTVMSRSTSHGRGRPLQDVLVGSSGPRAPLALCVMLVA